MESGTRASTQPVPEVHILKMSNRTMINYNYLIVDPATGQSVIVDPAWEMDKVDAALQSTGSTLGGVLITHTHADHIDLAAAVADRYECPIWMSNQEIAVSRFSAPQLFGIDEKPWFVGQMLITPLLTPGHTPGCMCFLIGENVFTGDVLFAEGCGMCPDLTGAYQMFASLEAMKRRLSPATRVFPGHSFGRPPGQPFERVMHDNIYLQFSDAESFASFRMRKGQSRGLLFAFK